MRGGVVRLLGAVGDDAFADVALATLREAGVDVSGVGRSDRPTGAAFIAVDPNGRNAITVAAGANADADAAALRRLDLCARDLLLLQREVPDAQGEAAARVAKDAGARVVLNLAPSGAMPERYLALVDIMVLNEHEAADLASVLAVEPGHPGSYEGLAERLRSGFDMATVVTLGPDGAVGWRDGVRHRATAPAVDVVDTTGAGDAFTGAFAAALAEEQAFEDALRFGTVAGSLACTRHGAQTGIPERPAIDAASACMAP